MIRASAAAAAKAFGEALEKALEDLPEVQDPEAFGRRAALLVVSDMVWGQILGPLYDVEQVQTILKVKTRQAVSDLAKRGRLLALDGSGGRKLYPAFQFGPRGRPYPEIAKVLEIFEGIVETPYTIASWFVSPQDLLEEETPAAWLGSGKDSSQLLAAAQRSAGALGLF
jgi:hypothetical protein